MAQVHRAVAKRSDFGRPVALKRMLSHIASSEEMVKSFVREARLASYLRHENVAQTYDLGRVGDVYFIVMELITGRNLRAVLKHCARTTGPMPVRIALNILNQVCDALDYAHNLCDETGEPLGIIHRDVSPSNVIVSETGVVKLIDFGIAKVSGAGMQTMSGTLKGKFAYMAPEYIAGQIDARADLFAIGVIAHELLTNRPLFSGRDDIDTLTRVRDMHIAPPSNKNPLVPPEIDDIVMTALARDPERRWQHATALRTALTTLTKRLDLVATNTQVVQWLDWAFSQVAGAPQPSDQHETDTETDAQPINDDPSISIEQCTVQLLAMSQKMTLVTPGGDPSPPVKTPVGTPAYVPAQRPTPAPITDRGSGPAVTIRDSRDAVVVPHATSAVVPSGARSSSQIPVRVASPSAPPPVGSPVPLPGALVPPSARPNATVLGTSAPAIRPPPGSVARAGRISSPPPIHPNAAPMSAALAAHLNAAQGLAAPDGHDRAAAIPPPAASAAPARPTPGFAAPGSGAPGYGVAPGAPGYGVAPGVPPVNMAPFAAPRPRAPTPWPPPSYDAARSAVMQRELAQRGSVPPTAAAAPGSSRLLAVVLVVLAAAIAAITVYFVLPLLT
jgi:eukaryotic-like serine/threonine-protein kinase